MKKYIHLFLIISIIVFQFSFIEQSSAENGANFTDSLNLKPSPGPPAENQNVTVSENTYTITPPPSGAAGVYNLELKRWGIYNDNTHPVETTSGMNKALKWAHDNGYKIFKVPAGTYLISKGTKVNDTTAHIIMVSDMTLWLDDNAVLQKEANGYEGYVLLYVGQDVNNATIKGGTYRGDKDTHDYSGKDYPWSQRTHESGVGIMLAGAGNVTIDGVKSINFTGDALCICGKGTQINILYESDFESGSIDDKGKRVNDPTKIRTKHNLRSKFNDPVFQLTRLFSLSMQAGRPQNVPAHVYFYKTDGTFISSVKNQELMWSNINIPANASYFEAVLDMPKTYKGMQLQYWSRSVTRNSVVQNSEFASSRRQGITVAGADNVLISNNKIHDIKGTAPQSGIDLEGGTGQYGDRNTNLIIKNNKLYNNEAYNVILYDGANVTVEDNYLGTNSSKTTVGVAVSSPFRDGAVIKNNTFDGSKIAVGNESKFIGNIMNNSLASIAGSDVTIDGMVFNNSSLVLNSDQPYGVNASNIAINNTIGNGLVINKQPARVKNVTITGASNLWAVSGNAPDGSVFDNLKIIGFGNGFKLPRGTYNNCAFQSAPTSTGSPGISLPGTYVFDGCKISTHKATALLISADAAVTVKNSSLDVKGPLFGNLGAIIADKAKSLSILNNQFDLTALTASYVSAIKIGNFGGSDTPADVFNATIKGNTITTNIAAKGISTTEAARDAPPYRIENNILKKAKLDLKSNDIKINNQETPK